MNKVILSALIALASVSLQANESVGENVNSKAHNVKRSLKKGGHRMKEAVCMKSDLKCLAEKGKHRATEGGDFVKDKATSGVDAVDSDSKAND